MDDGGDVRMILTLKVLSQTMILLVDIIAVPLRLMPLISSCLFWAQSRPDWRVSAQTPGVMPPRVSGQGPPHVSLSQSLLLPPFDKQANTDTATGQETLAISGLTSPQTL